MLSETKKIRLLVSVSGGKSSMYMAVKLWQEYLHCFEMIFVFANTGQEWEETLIFVHLCDLEWGLGTIWVETVVHPESGTGCTHRVVDFRSASRNGEPFENVISKYGIPNVSFPHCTRELKLRPIVDYARSVGWEAGGYVTAVGIRADEPGRIRKDANAVGIIYPLAHIFPSDKSDVVEWWEQQSFQLPLLEHQGNCKWCWKKSLKKHMRIIGETPEVYDFPNRMEESYALAGNRGSTVPATFFRGGRSVQSLFAMAELLPVLQVSQETNRPEEDAGCSESCEAF